MRTTVLRWYCFMDVNLENVRVVLTGGFRTVGEMKAGSTQPREYN
jgi:hypothetical protein